MRGVLHIGLRKKITVIPYHITGEKENFLIKVLAKNVKEAKDFFTHTKGLDDNNEQERG